MSYLNRHKQVQTVKDDAKSTVSAYSNTKSVKSNTNTNDPKKKEQDKLDILEKMKQNDEKHKQLMMENQKRRREQEKKQKQQEDDRRLQDMQVLGQRKQDKEEAYIKYLRKNSKNVLENMKGQANQNPPQQAQTHYPKQTSVKPSPQPKSQSQTHYPHHDRNTFAALDLETNQKHKASVGNQIRQDFEKSWAEEEFEVMRKSELLDSLDLETKPKKRPPTQQKQQIEELIGYEEAASEDEDDIWNQTLRNGKRESRKPQRMNNLPQASVAQKLTGEMDEVISKASQPQKPLEQKQSIGRQSSIDRKQEKPEKIVTNIKPTQNGPPPVRRTSQPKKPSQVQRKLSPNTMATREADIDAQQFLKEDMMHMNEEEQRVQKEIAAFNAQTNQKINDINQKFGIRTNLVSSQQVRNPQAKVTAAANETQIEASLVRIENLLTGKQQQKSSQPTQNHPQPLQNLNKPQPPQVNQQFQIGAQIALQQYQQSGSIPQQTFGLQQPIYQPINQQQQQPQQFQQPNQQQQPPYQQQPFPPFPQYVLHQDHQSFYNEPLLPPQYQMPTQMIQQQQQNQPSSHAQLDPSVRLPQQNIYNSHQEPSNLIKQAPQNQYNYSLESQQPPSLNTDQLTQLLLQNPQILDKLGFQPKIVQEDIREEIMIDEEQQSTFSDGRTFKITKRRGAPSVRSDQSMMSTFSKVSERPTGYAQAAAQKKNPKPLQEQIAEAEEEEPNYEEGKIQMAGNAQLLFD